MNNVCKIQDLLKSYAALKQGTHSIFFKTGPGEYAEHELFLGVSVPVVRTTSRQFATLSLEEVQCFISSPYNEERLLALFILILQYKKADDKQRKLLYEFCVKNLHHINNWNLVDRSYEIIGAYIFEYKVDRNILREYARSNDLWKRRIAIITTLYFIKKSDFVWTFTIAKILLDDTHDLIHKAVGWMLREVGQKDIKQLKAFLDEYAPIMPRTMLRYAIEKLPQDERKFYMQKKSLPVQII